MNNDSLYNSKVEIGARVLLILEHSKKPLSISELSIYDFFAIHSDVFDINLTSLHPTNPKFGLELYAKEKVLKESIHFLIHKGLLKVILKDNEIKYISNNFTSLLVSYFDSSYFNNLQIFVNKITSELTVYSEEELQQLVEQKILRLKNYTDYN